MVTVLEGKGRFTVGGEVFYVEEGETLIMPKDIPHAVYGEEIQDAADRVFLNYKSCCIYRLCGTNIHAGGIFALCVQNFTAGAGREHDGAHRLDWFTIGSFMRPVVISWKEKRCLRLIAGRWRR